MRVKRVQHSAHSQRTRLRIEILTQKEVRHPNIVELLGGVDLLGQYEQSISSYDRAIQLDRELGKNDKIILEQKHLKDYEKRNGLFNIVQQHVSSKIHSRLKLW